MTVLNTLKLTLPDGEVYAASGDLEVEFQQTSQAFYESGNTLSNIVSRAGGGSKKASVNINLGGGVRFVTWQFRNWKGDTEEWGPASSGDDAITKLQTFEKALAESEMGSTAVGKLEVGEYNEVGRFDPLSVGLANVTLSFTASDPSAFTGSVKFIESVDLDKSFDVPLVG